MEMRKRRGMGDKPAPEGARFTFQDPLRRELLIQEEFKSLSVQAADGLIKEGFMRKGSREKRKRQFRSPLLIKAHHQMDGNQSLQRPPHLADGMKPRSLWRTAEQQIKASTSGSVASHALSMELMALRTTSRRDGRIIQPADILQISRITQSGATSALMTFEALCLAATRKERQISRHSAQRFKGR
ncbi:uncharacterized protein LOC119787360 isoform X2 [Cyprinodon tularosa]|uniref:uncharacterized protein LOC119787360 isoform X2 n=1 Tax=Cyprinodon tularosa TaxID=77115 RepID=UPI0018E22C78|nr:uncharacterized protein LOC119787360 isoform X2 [Cyprinodon tularosa]